MEKLSSSPWATDAKEHWKKYRPKMYAALERSGKLNQHLNMAVEQTKNDYAQMIEDGMPVDAAWEAVRERYLFLPTEKDVPVLGENPNPILDPGDQGSIIESRPRMTLAGAVRASNMRATSKQSKPS
jgi:hypothetical protein